MEEHAEALAEAVDRVLAAWVERSVARIMVAYQGSVPAEVRAAAADAGEAARSEVGAELRELLERDIDDQRTNPLSVLRGAVRFPTAVLRAAGVPPVVRDDFKERAFPDDIYDLVPGDLAGRGRDAPRARSGLGRVEGWRAPAATTAEGASMNADQARTSSMIVACVPDLMDRSKLAAAAAEPVRFVNLVELNEIAPSASLVVIDLGRPGCHRGRGSGARRGPHDRVRLARRPPDARCRPRRRLFGGAGPQRVLPAGGRAARASELTT